ncbi:hypothetical protein [Bacillus sp. AK128]
MLRFKTCSISLACMLLIALLFSTSAMAEDMTAGIIEERVISNHSNYKQDSLKIVDSIQISGTIKVEDEVKKPYTEPLELSEAQQEQLDEISKSLLSVIEDSGSEISISNEDELVKSIKETLVKGAELEKKEKVVSENPATITAAVVTYKTVKSDFVTFDHQEIFYYDNDKGMFLSQSSISGNEEIVKFTEKYKEPVGNIGMRTSSSLIVTGMILILLFVPFIMSSLTSRSRSSHVSNYKKYNM